MKNTDRLGSPMNHGWGAPNPDGDKRDTHTGNPAPELSAPHARGKGDPANDFQEVLNGTPRRGNVDVVAKDVVASPMMGQRRSATGEYESEKRRDKV